MKTLTINVTRKNGKYIGTLDECPRVSAEADLLDELIFAMKVRIMNYTDEVSLDDLPEALTDGPLKFRIVGEESAFTNIALERDTKSRLALNKQMERMDKSIDQLGQECSSIAYAIRERSNQYTNRLTLEEVALQIFCQYQLLTIDGNFCPSDKERMKKSFDLAKTFLTFRDKRHLYYWEED